MQSNITQDKKTPTFLDNGLSQDDPEWIGAWWLGWLVQTIIAAPWVVIFLFMPAHFKNDSNVMHTYTKNESKGTQATDSGHQPIQSVTEKKKSISIAAVIKSTSLSEYLCSCFLLIFIQFVSGLYFGFVLVFLMNNLASSDNLCNVYFNVMEYLSSYRKQT